MVYEEAYWLAQEDGLPTLYQVRAGSKKLAEERLLEKGLVKPLTILGPISKSGIGAVDSDVVALETDGKFTSYRSL